jgi:3-phosphoshikimate 1-carboxyvinyltransferase
LAALGLELEHLGGTMRSTASTVEIDGGGIRGGIADAHGDHRIAMACAIAALAAEHEVAIEGYSCVSKSYPGFFSDLDALQVNP